MSFPINKLYKVQIDSEKYVLNSNESALITVSVKDFNNNPIPNESITITCQNGNFNTNLKSFTGQTNSSGLFTVTYTSKSNGLDVLTANNTSIIIFVDTWEEIILDWTDTTTDSTTFLKNSNDAAAGTNCINANESHFFVNKLHRLCYLSILTYQLDLQGFYDEELTIGQTRDLYDYLSEYTIYSKTYYPTVRGRIFNKNTDVNISQANPGEITIYNKTESGDVGSESGLRITFLWHY